MKRDCGECSLCCKLLPVPPLQKKAGQRCAYQRHGKGCTVYHTRMMPIACGVWNCRWLVNDDCDDLARPDRSHYVIDLMPDFVTLQSEQGEHHVQVVQIWCDPKHPHAHRDPKLRAWMLRRAKDGIATLVRYGARDAITIFPPPMVEDNEWHEFDGRASDRATVVTGKTHTFADIERALGPSRIIVED
jgi:hypothetical protein